MKLCACDLGPLRSAFAPDKIVCRRCGHFTPHGQPANPDRVRAMAAEIRSLAAELAKQWPYVHDLAHDSTRRVQNGHASGPSDPTGSQATDPTRLYVGDRAAVISRLLERALWALRNADEAVGDCLLAAEAPGPAEHVQAPFHDPASLFPGRPDLADAHAAKARRNERGEL